MTIRPLAAAALVVVGAGAAGPSPARALDADGWVDLVQMPVAVARLDLAGVPLADVRLLVPALNVREVEPSLFLESVRGLPVLWGGDGYDDDRYGDDRGEGMGAHVQAMHARGLRGRQLADAIHDELNRRGVPAGPKGRRGHDVFDPDWIPDRWVDARFQDDDLFRGDGGRGAHARVLARGRGHGNGRGNGNGPAARGRGNGNGQGNGNGKPGKPGGVR